MWRNNKLLFYREKELQLDAEFSVFFISENHL